MSTSLCRALLEWEDEKWYLMTPRGRKVLSVPQLRYSKERLGTKSRHANCRACHYSLRNSKMIEHQCTQMCNSKQWHGSKLGLREEWRIKKYLFEEYIVKFLCWFFLNNCSVSTRIFHYGDGIHSGWTWWYRPVLVGYNGKRLVKHVATIKLSYTRHYVHKKVDNT